MDIAVSHPAFTTSKMVVRTAGFFSGPKILLNGQQAKGKRGAYEIADNGGNIRRVTLKASFFDAIPNLTIDEEQVPLARPLAWYEYIWMGLPIVLVFSGGALGALFGLGAIYSSTRIFRSARSSFVRYAVSGLISVGAVVGFVVVAGVLQILIHSVPRK